MLFYIMSLKFQTGEKTHVNTPKFFHRVESNNFFEKLVPEIAL